MHNTASNRHISREDGHLKAINEIFERQKRIELDIAHLWENRDALPGAFADLKAMPQWEQLFAVLGKVIEVFTPQGMAEGKKTEHTEELKKAILTMWYQYHLEKEAIQTQKVSGNNREGSKRLTELLNTDRQTIFRILVEHKIEEKIRSKLDPTVELIIFTTARCVISDKKEVAKMEKLLTIAYGLITQVENS